MAMRGLTVTIGVRRTRLLCALCVLAVLLQRCSTYILGRALAWCVFIDTAGPHHAGAQSKRVGSST